MQGETFRYGMGGGNEYDGRIDFWIDPDPASADNQFPPAPGQAQRSNSLHEPRRVCREYKVVGFIRRNPTGFRARQSTAHSSNAMADDVQLTPAQKKTCGKICATTGATAGAAMGSPGGPPGMAIRAVAGLVVGAVAGWSWGSS